MRCMRNVKVYCSPRLLATLQTQFALTAKLIKDKTAARASVLFHKMSLCYEKGDN